VRTKTQHLHRSSAANYVKERNNKRKAMNTAAVKGGWYGAFVFRVALQRTLIAKKSRVFDNVQ